MNLNDMRFFTFGIWFNFQSLLQSGCKTIIIEPTELGEDTENWIIYGNYLHRSAIVTGAFAVFSGFYWKDLRFLPLPFGFTSCLCATLYTVCWGFDPCSHYKVWIIWPKVNKSRYDISYVGILTYLKAVVLMIYAGFSLKIQ